MVKQFHLNQPIRKEYHFHYLARLIWTSRTMEDPQVRVQLENGNFNQAKTDCFRAKFEKCRKWIKKFIEVKKSRKQCGNRLYGSNTEMKEQIFMFEMYFGKKFGVKCKNHRFGWYSNEANFPFRKAWKKNWLKWRNFCDSRWIFIQLPVWKVKT